ncbi:MAG: hypothetical protein LLF93_06140 [Bacteroidales bacterium]|nr:hypothetical protein [Bacteroidales bacterium]
MVTIKDIYQRFDGSVENSPPSPYELNSTPLQLLEWKKQNSRIVEDYESFPVGRKLLTTPAFILSIDINYIYAKADYSAFLNGKKFDLFPRLQGVHDLRIGYTLYFDEKLYETVKRIHNGSWVEFEGEIISFRYDTCGDSDGDPYRAYTFDLKLSEIKVISKPSLSPFSLGVNYKPNQTKCFIATAAFGNQDIMEVILLREFRDNVLRHFFIGRIFISVYNILSPPIAMVIRKSNWLRKITRMLLRKAVLPLTKIRTNNVEK